MLGNVPGTECIVGPKWQSPYPHGTYRVTGKKTLIEDHTMGHDWWQSDLGREEGRRLKDK